MHVQEEEQKTQDRRRQHDIIPNSCFFLHIFLHVFCHVRRQNNHQYEKYDQTKAFKR
jgi:hypothetical protein